MKNYIIEFIDKDIHQYQVVSVIDGNGNKILSKTVPYWCCADDFAKKIIDEFFFPVEVFGSWHIGKLFDGNLIPVSIDQYTYASECQEACDKLNKGDSDETNS